MTTDEGKAFVLEVAAARLAPWMYARFQDLMKGPAPANLPRAVESLIQGRLDVVAGEQLAEADEAGLKAAVAAVIEGWAAGQARREAMGMPLPSGHLPASDAILRRLRMESDLRHEVRKAKAVEAARLQVQEEHAAKVANGAPKAEAAHTENEQRQPETHLQRQDRRLARLRELGGDHDGERVIGKRGAKALLSREEGAAGRPMWQDKEIGADLKAAVEREKAAPRPMRPGSSAFNQ
jgi:hypothetical protein